MVGLKYTAQAIHDELQARGVEVKIVSAQDGLLRYKKGDSWHLLRSSTPDTDSAIGAYICDRKPLANDVAISLDVPVPASAVISADVDAAQQLLQQYERVVVKPSDSAHGRGVTVDVTTNDQLEKAVQRARADSSSGLVVVQQQVTGDDIRVLVLGGKVVAAAKRVPAQVIGDGQKTLRELIEHQNSHNPERGLNYQKRLNQIDVVAAELFLGARIDDERPTQEEVVQVVGTANIGTGGEAHDVTDEVLANAHIVDYAQKIAKSLNMTVCGVDFLWDKTADSIHLIEMNACPSFGLHSMPTKGQPQPVTKYLVDYLLKD